MKIFQKLSVMLLVLTMVFSFTACSGQNSSSAPETGKTDTPAAMETPAASTEADASSSSDTRTVTDSAGREVTIPSEVKSIICLNVGALRYTCYMQAQDLVVGVEDYEQKPGISRLYNYVNFDRFSKLPVVGNNGEHYIEEIINVNPDVIIISSYGSMDADTLHSKTGIPVVTVPGSDTTMDEGAYETFRIMGEVYNKKDRADELCAYMDEVKKDLDTRTADIKDEDKPSVYVGGVSFKGAHGFEGTEAGYGPFSIIHAKNLADQTGQNGAFDIDPIKKADEIFEKLLGTAAYDDLKEAGYEFRPVRIGE